MDYRDILTKLLVVRRSLKASRAWAVSYSTPAVTAEIIQNIDDAIRLIDDILLAKAEELTY